jgi:hypothetical protein
MFKVLTVYAPDGNPSGIFNNNRGYRALPDIMLYIIIFVLQEMAKGIVIDAFSTLRELKNSRVDDTENVCFICGIPKVTFERQIDRAAFDSHVKNFHHLWNYLYFIIYLWEQDKDDDDGLEHDIRHCIENNDIGWFPMNKAMQMQHVVVNGETDTVEQKFYSELDGMESRFHGAVGGFSSYMSKSIDRVSRIVESTHAMNAPKRTAGGKSRPGTNHESRNGTAPTAGGLSSNPLTRVGSPAIDQSAPISRQVSNASGPGPVRRPSFHATPAFLEKEEYCALQIQSIGGLELSEYQYTKVSCRVVTPKNTFDVTATDYVASVLALGSVDDSVSVAGSLNGGESESVEIDDDLDAQEAFMRNIYATHHIDLSFIHKDRRDIILFKAVDYRSELQKKEKLNINIAIQVVLNEEGKIPKLLGTLQFELMSLLQHFDTIRSEEKRFRHEEILRIEQMEAASKSSLPGMGSLSIHIGHNQKDFPLNAHGTIHAKASGVEIIDSLASGDKIPLEMEFEQRNSQAKKCIMLAHFINHQKLI